MEKASEGVSSSDPLGEYCSWLENKSDDGDDVSSASSHFSSCEGSELERYGSANSVLGTASICSSTGNHGDFLDSFRSSGPGEDSVAEGSSSIDRHWRNLRPRDDTLFGRFDGFSDGDIDFSAENSATELTFPMKISGSYSLQSYKQNEEDLLISSGLHVERRESHQLGFPSLGNPLESSCSSTQMGGPGTDPQFSENLNLCFEGSTSVPYERSDDEGSTLDYGTDGQDASSTIWNGNSNRIGEGRSEKENPLLMNSSVAFGNSDWDEFERETEVIQLDSLPLSSDQSYHHQIENSVHEIQDVAPNQQLLSDVLKVRSSSNCNSEENHHYKSMETITSTNEDVTGIDEIISNSYDGNSSSRGFPEPTRESENKEFEPADNGVMDADSHQAKNIDPSELYHDMVLEMEEILLDSGERAGARVSQGDKFHTYKKSHHLRDGSSTASTSETDDIFTLNNHFISIDEVEVIGTKQKKGDVSFGERLVGVKEYTVYILRVKSGKDQWEIERRYRDFLSLYHQLNALFTDHGLTLPTPWNSVVRESRNFFGNSSPSIISQRSILIQDCLNSALHFKFSSGHPSPLTWFLHRPGQIQQKVSPDDFSKLGKTISLILQVKVRKSMGQMLESQRYLCAGCHRRLDSGKNLAVGLAHKLGWEKNRFCEYTGQLFCSVCHANDTAILPARVLHHWDFSQYSVSQLAKAFLDSIYEQPMLCVSAVNPFLFSKVPALQQIMGVRKRIASMLPCVLCPFRRSIHRRLGSRRYLLEENDFFALRDLVDLSKGAFSGLPTLVETVEQKILVHIAQQCLICYDSGSSCAARQNCIDPSSLIFPFQEAEAVRCSSCQLLFHRPCIQNMGSCPCGKLTPVNGELLTSLSGGVDFELKGFVDSPAESSTDAKALSGFFADLMSKARPEKLWRTRKTQPVILMGSFTGTEG